MYYKLANNNYYPGPVCTRDPIGWRYDDLTMEKFAQR